MNSKKNVTPAKAGVRKGQQKKMDSGFRRNDVMGCP